jgi:formate-dependent phosphoribosylglycinamide formyltransferase (GAR transformylase)
MGVALARGIGVEEAKRQAIEAASRVRIDYRD